MANYSVPAKILAWKNIKISISLLIEKINPSTSVFDFSSLFSSDFLKKAGQSRYCRLFSPATFLSRCGKGSLVVPREFWLLNRLPAPYPSPIPSSIPSHIPPPLLHRVPTKQQHGEAKQKRRSCLHTSYTEDRQLGGGGFRDRGERMRWGGGGKKGRSLLWGCK